MLIFLTGAWKTFSFTLVWLGERWVPPSFCMWGLTSYVWCQGSFTSVLSIFVPCRLYRHRVFFYLAFSKSSVRETHMCLLSEDDCTLYQRQDPGNRQKIQIRRKWSEVVFGVSAREVLEHTSANKCLVDSRWCSSITGAKFCRGSFSGPLPFLSSHQM